MIKFHIEAPGMAELAAALKKMPEEISAKAVRASMGEAANPVVKEAQRNAPVDSGRLQLQIGKQSAIKGDEIFVRIGVLLKTKRQISRNFEKKAAGKSKGTVLTHDAYYDFMVEYGTKNQSAKPFLRPAFDSQKENYIAVLSDSLRRKIDKFFLSLPNTK